MKAILISYSSSSYGPKGIAGTATIGIILVTTQNFVLKIVIFHPSIFDVSKNKDIIIPRRSLILFKKRQDRRSVAGVPDRAPARESIDEACLNTPPDSEADLTEH